MKYMLLLLVLALLLHLCGGLRLVNNGYEDLYVVIQDSIKENDELIDRIKVIFHEASTLLYKATKQRAYFKSIVINVPQTWTKKESYRIVSPLSSSASHIEIGNRNMKTPVTVGSNQCGESGLYTYLHDESFVLKNGPTKWGKHGSVIVHEWGHLRWGLKDEYPTIRRDSGRNWSFYQESGKWNPVGCSRSIQGYASKSCKKGTADPSCDENNVSNIIGRTCRFCPDLTQALTASLMSFQYIPSVTQFCDKDDPSTPEYLRHDSAALNEQNMYCNGKSAWEIMREHDDFKDGNNPPLNADSPPPSEFIIAQEMTDKVRVLVMDTSGSMAGARINALYGASKLMIQSYLPDGSWLSMVDFDSSAVLLSPFVQIDSIITRQNLVAKLPRVGDGGTCIACGLELALSTLVAFKQIDSVEESEIILISDGDVGRGIELEIQSLEDAGVVVHCIAVTQDADQRMEEISRRTGGRCFAYTENGTVSLSAVLSEIISGGSDSGSSAATTMMIDNFSVSPRSPAVISYNIDDGIGRDTAISVISKTVSNIGINLSGPLNRTIANSADQVDSLSLLIPGVSKLGEYTTEITSSKSTNLEVLVTSKPTSPDAEVIRPVVKLSTDQLDFTRTESIPIMYVYLRKGESPVKKANVTAMVFGPDGTKTCKLSLLDNGIDPDVMSGDGIYTAFVHRGFQGGNGRHNSKVFITGDQDTVVTLDTSSESAILDDEMETEEDKATGNFERVAIPDAYAVTNYNVISDDLTPPGRITDIEVIDIIAGIPNVAPTRNYTITWTATGDDLNIGQASLYEMRISSNLRQLRYNFVNTDLLHVRGVNMTPSIAGQVERVQMIVSSSDAFTSTVYFAIVAIDEVGNRGLVSNIIPITVGEASKIVVVQETCTDDCYSIQTDCGRSVTIPNGHVDLNNTTTTPGNVVPVVCDNGFQLNGGTNITCLENGTWSESVTCIVRDCGRSVTIPNGHVDLNNTATTPWNVVPVVCDTGFQLNGGTNITCLENGTWSESVTCIVRDCGRSVTIPNGHVDLHNTATTPGNVVPVVCDTGFQLNGGTNITCLENGTWSESVTCIARDQAASVPSNAVTVILDCGRSVTILNGHVDLNNTATTSGNVVPVVCDTGFQLDGGTNITCLENGTWSKFVTCIPRDCGRSVTIPNGHVDLNSTTTTPGNVVPVICDSGFQPNGGTNITCLENGTWSESVTCIARENMEDSTTIGVPVIIGICLSAFVLVILGMIIVFVLRKCQTKEEAKNEQVENRPKLDTQGKHETEFTGI